MQTNSAFTFETGANTAQANNLVLSVMNDGNVYSTRLHCIKALLQGATHGDHSIRQLVKEEAVKQRLQGSKFKPEHISNAADIVQNLTIQEIIEGFKYQWNGEKLIAQCRRWFDKINGNSYFSVWVQIPTAQGFSSFVVPFQYGSGSHWEYETITVLKKIGFFDGNDNRYNREYPIVWDDRGYMKKKDMFNGLYI